MEKGGLSTVVATVLVVLVTVAAVTLLWAAVRPLFGQSAFIEDPRLRFSIDTAESYTVYDPESAYLRVRIARGGDSNDPPVIALNFLINIDGTTIARKTYHVMPPNHAIVYYFIVGYHLDIQSAKVAPVYLVDGAEREGRAFDIETRIPVRPGALIDRIGQVPVEPDPDNPVTDGLVLYYSFNSQFSDGVQLLDESGAGHAGEFHGDVQLATHDGRTFATFDGSGDYIAVGNGQELADSTADDKTIAFWARFDCPIDVSNINQAPFGAYENYFVSFFDPCRDFVDTEVRVNYDAAPADPRSFVSENLWNDLVGWEFYAIVIDKTEGEIRIYRGGELVDRRSGVAIGTTAPSPNFFVGATGASDLVSPDASSFLGGSLDELRVYNRALSDGEIRVLSDAWV